MKSDVIIVFGAAVWDCHRPSPSLRRRVLHSVELFNKKLSETILMTGGIGKFPPAEAILMRDLAIQHGVPSSNIVIESVSTSTFESISRCAEIMRRRGWNKAIVVTDSFHLLRSVYTLRSFGINASGSSPTRGKEETPRWKWICYSLREFIALPYYFLLIFLKKLRKCDNR